MAGKTTVQFYYHQAGFTFAFSGNDSDIVIDKNKNVFKDYISPMTLVVAADGTLGAAGKQVDGFMNIVVNTRNTANETNFIKASFADENGKIQNIRGGDRTDLNEWGHGVIVVDNELLQMRLYVDKVLVQTIDIPDRITLFTSVKDTLIGKNTKSELAHFDLNGSIDDFRIDDNYIAQEEYIEKTNVEASEDSGFIQLQEAGDTTDNLSVGQYVWYPGKPFGDIWNDYPTITTIDSSTTFTVSDNALDAYTGTMRIWDNHPLTAETQAVGDLYDFGERTRHFNKKTFIAPKGENKGNVASFKIKAEFPIQVRGIAIEYNDGVIRR